MSATTSPMSDSRNERSPKGRVRAIEYARRAVAAPESVSTNHSRYIGRVGALAFALGIGSAVLAMPMAFADETGSAGSTGVNASDAEGTTTAPARRGPARGRHRHVASPRQSP